MPERSVETSNASHVSDQRREGTTSRLPVAAGFALFAVSIVTIGTFALAILHTRNAWYVVTSERICIQSGALTKVLCVIDLDKVLTVEVSNSVLERRFGLQSIQFVHAGGKSPAKNGLAWVIGDNYAMSFVPLDDKLVSSLLNQWLPRDNGGRA